MIDRFIRQEVSRKLLESNKVVVLLGPRQVGKTTLVKSILSEMPGRVLEVNADQTKYIDVFSSRDLHKMQGVLGNADLLFIDEAQRIPDIGINLKILHDEMPQLKIIATGSSSFELANRTKEPLTGRTWTFTLLPIAQVELAQQSSSFELGQQLEDFLVFGSYPEAITMKALPDKIQYLQELSAAYLYKDILEITAIKHADKLTRLLRLLAFQTGSEVSFNELGNSLQMSKDTVAHYVDLLEKAFVIFRLTGFSRNLRKEVTKMDKIYFYDNGIRNALIDNFAPLGHRNDAGQLWENFLVSERQKRNRYQQTPVRPYFWRTYTGAELDYIEEGMGELAAFEFKFSRKVSNPPAAWLAAYPNATFQCVNRDNYLDFLVPL